MVVHVIDWCLGYLWIGYIYIYWVDADATMMGMGMMGCGPTSVHGVSGAVFPGMDQQAGWFKLRLITIDF